MSDQQNKEEVKPDADKPDSAFLSDLTDSRKKGDWKTKYCDIEAQQAINWEKRYLLIVFSSAFTLAIISGVLLKQYFFKLPFEVTNLKIYLFAFLGGLLGGTIFSMKWLIHSVAKSDWNIDRQLWRIFTPLMSAAIGLVVVLLVEADYFQNPQAHHVSLYKSYAIGFLAGYFSDNAIGKLTEIAQVLFGSTHKKGN